MSGWTEITIEPLVADFSLTALSVLPTSDVDLNTDSYPGDNGARLDVSFTLANGGNTGPTDFQVVFFFSDDAVLSGDDIQLADPYGMSPYYLTVDYGTSVTLDVSLDIDEAFPRGEYQLIAVIQPYSPNGGGS